MRIVKQISDYGTVKQSEYYLGDFCIEVNRSRDKDSWSAYITLWHRDFRSQPIAEVYLKYKYVSFAKAEKGVWWVNFHFEKNALPISTIEFNRKRNAIYVSSYLDELIKQINKRG